ncbi:MAG: hypothetical protein IJX76_07545, partial [Clostridia bacterium]|nr:hypothetical protein [Clostridia bacterium]
MKKLLSFLIVVAMLACMLPVMAITAADEGPVPIATKNGTVLTGKVVEPNLKDFNITDTELSLGDCDQGYLIFDDEMKAGRLEGTIVTNASKDVTGVDKGCSGIVFGLTDKGNDRVFWEQADQVSMYWLMIDEVNRLRLCRVGENANYVGGTWYDMINPGSAECYDFDNAGVDVTKGVNIAAVWDGNGNIKCYANDQLIYDITDHTPLTGSLYGVRMKAKSVSGAYFTSITATDYEDIAATITLDGDLSDWIGTDTVQIVGSGDFEGKKAVWYAVMRADGLYLACDAYHDKYITDMGEWWKNTNFEMHIGDNPQAQYWVSARGADGTKAYGAKSDNVTDAIMITEELTDAATAYHTVTEVFIAKDKLPANSLNADGSIRVGMAWKTNNDVGTYDDCNNGGTNEVDSWWAAPGTYPNGGNKAVVNATGVYTKAVYNEEFGGITATYYKAPTVNYVATIGEDNRSARVSFDGNEKFDASIDALINGSMLMAEEKVTSVTLGNEANWYIYKWTGTMTAKEAGTYTLIGRKIDNGFTMFVDGEKVYEYWGASHWFDGAGDRLVSNDASFTLEANETVDVEIYFLELDGGDALEIFATTTPDDANSGSNINDAFTFNLTREHYSTDKAKWANDTVGRGNGDNGGQCEDQNFKFDSSIDKLMDVLVEGETKTVATFENALIGDDAYVIKYTGMLVPSVSGSYTFGATDVDNGFMLEIAGERAYEFWAGYSWNDNTGNTYNKSVDLEAGKAYEFTAYFLETNGGEALNLNCSIDGGDKVPVNTVLAYYSECPNHVFSEATCVAPATCATCGETEGEVDSTNHVGETELKNAKDATCTDAGYTGDTYCKDCGNKIADGEEIA